VVVWVVVGAVVVVVVVVVPMVRLNDRPVLGVATLVVAVVDMPAVQVLHSTGQLELTRLGAYLFSHSNFNLYWQKSSGSLVPLQRRLVGGAIVVVVVQSIAPGCAALFRGATVPVQSYSNFFAVCLFNSVFTSVME